MQLTWIWSSWSGDKHPAWSWRYFRRPAACYWVQGVLVARLPEILFRGATVRSLLWMLEKYPTRIQSDNAYLPTRIRLNLIISKLQSQQRDCWKSSPWFKHEVKLSKFLCQAMQLDKMRRLSKRRWIIWKDLKSLWKSMMWSSCLQTQEKADGFQQSWLEFTISHASRLHWDLKLIL